MKHVLASIIALIYFTVSSGMVMSVHYCMGEVSNIQVNQVPEERCICRMSKKETSSKGCCKTEFTMVKLADTHKASSASYDIQTQVSLVSRSLSQLEAPLYNTGIKIYTDIHGPPLLSEQDTYLLNCVFRI
ncbi:MAG: hypothetical protein U1C70_13150 [Sediminibacterium sp.]|jgi:hypothetical protein|uniref:HYC_CC_PP family protein n=1 Tax=Sediminibacterium sp. TaxID=1917865 RepID=UPI002ABCF444|nr:hypothetical protein [Sediminibacterium sp.]MDZ4072766.1 hypothetical protein [Sediminibacterium sp.]